uniref:Uncharacterized protein n=1 Tax=Leersia perrieri TaxID=77586 RepID=A0A0D9V4K2_9ORYZ
MAENPLLRKVLGIHLLLNANDIKILIDAANADLKENSGRIAKVRVRLRLFRCLADKAMATPMTLQQRRAVRVAVNEAVDVITASLPLLLERRRQLREVVSILRLLRANDFVVRAEVPLRRVLLAVKIGSATMVAYVVSRHGVPAIRGLVRIFSLGMRGFLERYRVARFLI